jgi:hypothetical protein
MIRSSDRLKLLILLRSDYSENLFWTAVNVIKESLHDYLLMESQKKISSTPSVERIFNDMLLNDNNLIINFNYTNTVNKIIEFYNYGNLKLNQYFIHGSLINNDIIIGIQDKLNIPNDLIFMKKSFHKTHQKSRFDIFSQIVGCEELILFGYSLGESDHTYFYRYFDYIMEKHKQFKINNLKKITIYHYKDEGKREIISQIDKLCKNELNTLNDFVQINYHDVTLY